LLSNEGVPLDEVMPLWIKHVVGTMGSITVAMDWTDYDDDDHTELAPKQWTPGREVISAVKSLLDVEEELEEEAVHRRVQGGGRATT